MEQNGGVTLYKMMSWHAVRALYNEWRLTALWYVGARESLKEYVDFAIPWWRRVGIAYRAWRRQGQHGRENGAETPIPHQ